MGHLATETDDARLGEKELAIFSDCPLLALGIQIPQSKKSVCLRYFPLTVAECLTKAARGSLILAHSGKVHHCGRESHGSKVSEAGE